MEGEQKEFVFALILGISNKFTSIQCLTGTFTMNIERELNLINFSHHLKSNPQKAIELALEYYTQFLDRQDQIESLKRDCQNLKRSCKELEIEKANIYAELEMLRISLEQEEQSKDDSDCDLHLSLPSFLPANPHNYLIP